MLIATHALNHAWKQSLSRLRKNDILPVQRVVTADVDTQRIEEAAITMVGVSQVLRALEDHKAPLGADALSMLAGVIDKSLTEVLTSIGYDDKGLKSFFAR